MPWTSFEQKHLGAIWYHIDMQVTDEEKVPSPARLCNTSNWRLVTVVNWLNTIGHSDAGR